MANGNIELALKVKADLQQAIANMKKLESTVTTNTREFKSLNNTATLAATAVDTIGAAGNKAEAGLSKTRKGVESISTQLSRLQQIAGSLAGITIGAGLVKQIGGAADKYNSLAARIRLVSASNDEAAQTFNSVIKMANNAGQQIDATAELYTRMARSLKGAGAAQSDLLLVTDTINKAAVVSGATAQESSAAIIQLSQGLAAGALRGEEFNSVAEQMPRIMEMLQKSLGVTRGELRKMAEEGKLTTEVVFTAIKESAGEINQEFAQMPLTISRAATEMSNAWLEFIGGTDGALGASRAVAGAISGLANNFELLAITVAGAAVAMGGKKVAALVATMTAARAATLETQQLAAAELNEARAAAAATEAHLARVRASGVLNPRAQAAAIDAHSAALTRLAAAEKGAALASTARLSTVGKLGSGLLALAGGPVGVAITATTFAVTGLVGAYSAMQERERAAEQAHKEMTRTLYDQTQQTLLLVDAQGQLKSSASTADAVQQQLINTTELERDVKKMEELTKKYETLKARIATATDPQMMAMQSPGALMYWSRQAVELEKLEKQIKALTPAVTSLNNAQSQLSDGLRERLNRALADATKTGKITQETLEKLSEVGPPNLDGELLVIIKEAEKQLASFAQESDKLKIKLEKDLANATYTAVEQLEQFRDKVVAAAMAAGKAPEDIDALRESMQKLVDLQLAVDKAQDDKRAAESAKRTGAQRAKAAESYVQGLEKQVTLLNKTQAEVRAYELAERNLSGALYERAKAALQALAADEQLQQTRQNAITNAQLEADYLRATGNEAAAAMLEMQTSFTQMRDEFAKVGNAEGLAWIDKLIPVQEAKIKLDEIKEQIDNAFSDQSRKENSIDVEVNAGLISEAAGRKQLLEVHQQTAAVISRYLPQLREMAEMPGAMGDAARAALEEMETRLTELTTATTAFEQAMKTGLESGLNTALENLATGTYELRDAWLDLVNAVMASMRQMVAQELTSELMAGFNSLNLFGGGADAATEATEAAANAMQYSTAITTASAAGAGTFTSAMEIAFSAGALTIGSAITSASAGSSAGSAVGSVLTAATGGLITGPGTGTSDSIDLKVSNGEYVMKNAAVSHYGANFLHALNNMQIPRNNAGGLVSAPQIDSIEGQFNAPTAAGIASSPAPEIMNEINQTLVFDAADAIAKGLSSPRGAKSFLTFLSANQSQARSALGVD
jgi:tape measure domain-containing protein